MYKVLLTLLLVACANAGVYDGVAIVVEDKPITLFDIQNEMKAEHLDAKKAADVLIRKKLEALEIKKRKIAVSSAEVYDDIEKMAKGNKLTISQLYDAVRERNGLSSEKFKEKIKHKLLSQKLYAAIAMSSLSEPSDEAVKEYYELHKEKFNHPKSFSVTIYGAKSKERLQEKVENPMFYAPDISSQDQTLVYNKISPKLAMLLQKTPLEHFTAIIPNGKNGFVSFYIKAIEKGNVDDVTSIKPQIINDLMADKREAVLSDYFARLRDNANINILRMPK